MHGYHETACGVETVPIGKVRELLKDPEFMNCRVGVIKTELIKKVEEHTQLFGK